MKNQVRSSKSQTCIMLRTKGSQMMVIMGGDWYIDVDSDGKVSWIYI